MKSSLSAKTAISSPVLMLPSERCLKKSKCMFSPLLYGHRSDGRLPDFPCALSIRKWVCIFIALHIYAVTMAFRPCFKFLALLTQFALLYPPLCGRRVVRCCCH